MRKVIPARPFRQSDDWKVRAPKPLAEQLELEHLADMAVIQRQAFQVFGKRER